MLAGMTYKRKEVIGDAVLYLGDCMDVLPTLPKVDAVITDPPYGINAEKAGGRGVGGWTEFDVCGWDKARPHKKVFDAFLHKGEIVIVWGGNYFTDYLPPSMGWLSWDKGQDGFSLADFELAWTNRNKAARRINYARALALRDVKEHPTQKPIAVMKWCIEQCLGAESVLDPFMGSGTTGVACAQLGRKFIGVEIEPKYFDISCRRIEQAYAQGKLFEPEPIRQEQQALI